MRAFIVYVMIKKHGRFFSQQCARSMREMSPRKIVCAMVNDTKGITTHLMTHEKIQSGCYSHVPILP